MKIQAINQNIYKSSFQKYFINDYFPVGRGQYLSQYKDEIVNSHETYFFRDDINWLTFKNYLNERFANCPKVDTVIYGCSDGSEPYTLSMLMQSMVKNPDKFFPIKAFDIIDSLIKENIKEKDSFKVQSTDFEKVRALYEMMALDYSPFIFQDDLGKYYLTNKTTNPVEFKQGNLIEDIDRMHFEKPVLFMARNMWPYVSPSEYHSFAKKLFEKLPKGSSVIIGAFDYKGNRYLGTNDFPNVLLESGFKQSNCNISRDIPIRNVAFEKD